MDKFQAVQPIIYTVIETWYRILRAFVVNTTEVSGESVFIIKDERGNLPCGFVKVTNGGLEISAYHRQVSPPPRLPLAVNAQQYCSLAL
jgi:hypothetical protein